MADSSLPEPRVVRVHDPSLSADASAALTRELREIIGADAVAVPSDRPDVAGEAHRHHGSLVANILGARMGAVFTAMTALAVAGVVLLAFDTTAALVIALVVLLAATGIAVGDVYRLMGETEHPSPETAALLEDEGIGDTDRLMQDLVDEFRLPRQ